MNHFPNSVQIGRKDWMWKNVVRLRRAFPKDFDFCPRTYILPEDFR